MAEWGVRLLGLDDGVQAVRQLRDACGRFNGPLLRVGSPLGYAYGIETGRTRGGRLARRAGPALYLRGAMLRVEPLLRAVVVGALEDGPAAAERAVEQAGDALMAEAQRLVPVRTGRLRGSIRAIRTGHGGD